ncbi:MAG: WD40 repeat domain-containing protein [Chloroflexota bacterium]
MVPTFTSIPLPAPQAIDLGTFGVGAAKDMTWSADGKMLAVESSAGGHVYDSSNWNLLASISLDSVQDGWLNQLIFFPDRQRLLFVAGYGRAFWQYNLRTQEISRVYENIGSEAFDQPFFSPDGRLFAFGSSICAETENNHICRRVLDLYDANTGELIRRIPEDGLDKWEDMEVYAFSPDSQLVATSGDDDVVRVWEVASGTLKYKLQHESDVQSLSFSPDGRILVSAGLDAAVRFWDMRNGKSLYVLHGTIDEFYQTAVYIDGGGKLLVNYYDGKFKEYALDEHYLPAAPLDIKFETEERLMTQMGQYTPELVTRVSPDGERMALLVNGNIQIWDLQTGQKTYTLPEYIREVYAIEFSPDENLLAVSDHNVHLWQIQPKKFIDALKVNGGQVVDIAFRPDGVQAAFALLGGNDAEIWDLTLRRKIRTLVSECPGGDYWYSARANVAYSPDGSKLAFAGGCGIVLADAATGVILEKFPNDLGESADISFSANGNTLIYVSVNGYRAWNLDTGKQVYFIKRVDDYQHSAALSSTLLAITSWHDPIRFLDPLSGKRLYEFPSGEGSNTIALSREGRVLALDNYSKISLLDSTSGAELLSMDFRLPYTITFSPGGKYLGARSYHENVHLWDVSGALQYANHIPIQTATPNVALTPTAQPTSTPAPTLAISMPTAPASTSMVHGGKVVKLGELGIGRIRTMAWSADGKLLAAGGYPGVYIFKAGESQPTQFFPAKSDLLVMQFSSDGRYLAGQVLNDSVHLWDVRTGKSLHTLKDIGCWNQGMEFSADNDLLIADCGDLKYTWQVGSGLLISKEEQTLKGEPVTGPYTLQTNMRNVRLVNAGSGEIVKTFEIPGMAPSLARFSPDGKTLAVWHYEYQIARTGLYYPGENSKTILQLWNVFPDRPPTLRAELATGMWLQEMMILEAFQGLAFSPDSRLLAAASGDGTTQIWDVASGRLLYTLPNGSKIYFSPDDRYLATLDDDSARIWSLTSGEPRIIWEISGFNRWSFDIAFAKGGRELVSVTDEYYKFFPVTNTNMTAPARLIKLPGIRGHSLALSADGSRMAYNTTEGILVGENNGGDPNWKMLTKFPEPLTYDRDLDLTFSPDGSLLASYDPDDIKQVWDLKTMESIELEDPASTPHVFISQFLFSPDGTLLFGAAEPSTCEPSSMYLWDTRTGKLVRFWTAQFYRFAFHPTLPLFVGADYMGGVVRYFDLRTGDLVKEVRANQYVQGMAFSPDGSLLALGYENRGNGEDRIEIRDSQTLALLDEIPGGGSSLAFSPDGTMLAIGMNDGRIEYWGWR